MSPCQPVPHLPPVPPAPRVLHMGAQSRQRIGECVQGGGPHEAAHRAGDTTIMAQAPSHRRPGGGILRTMNFQRLQAHLSLTPEGASLHQELGLLGAHRAGGGSQGQVLRGPTSEAAPTQPLGKAAKAARTSKALGYFVLFYFTKWRQKLVSRVVSCFPSHHFTGSYRWGGPAREEGMQWAPALSSHKTATSPPAQGCEPPPDPSGPYLVSPPPNPSLLTVNSWLGLL